MLCKLYKIDHVVSGAKIVMLDVVLDSISISLKENCYQLTIEISDCKVQVQSPVCYAVCKININYAKLRTEISKLTTGIGDGDCALASADSSLRFITLLDCFLLLP